LNQNKKFNIPKIIGHRGVKNLSPENTLQSITKAFELGLKWVEVDVKISKDKIPFLLHDDDLERTTSGSGLACKFDYFEIKKLDAGKYFFKENTNIYPPTLEEVLNLCNINKIGINIELKPNKGLEIRNVKEILKITKKFYKYVPLYFSSFDLESCIAIKKIIPNSKCGILIEDFKTNNLEKILDLNNKYNFFSCGLDIEIINKELIYKLKDKNLIITVFSKNNITNEEALYLWNMGVDSIFSDDPIDILKTE
tara:strand:+ start:248 stop:1006 length:759 start_codon:yes stop_codon:yes gene_type:complete